MSLLENSAKWRKKIFNIIIWEEFYKKSTFHLTMHSYVAFVEECYHAQFLSFSSQEQLFCGQTTLTSTALLDMAVGISFRKSKK